MPKLKTMAKKNAPKSRFHNPEGGGYRRHSQTHKDKRIRHRQKISDSEQREGIEEHLINKSKPDKNDG